MREFESNLGQYIRDMMDYKAALGYCPSNYRIVLLQFDRHCSSNYPNEINLTKEIVNTWAVLREGESMAYLNVRLTAVRQLGKYLQSIGMPAYVAPLKMTARQKKYTPHIFTESELKAFFHGADKFTDRLSPYNRYIVPVIFRLIYCCGLRPQEGRLIKMEDIDINSGKLFIRNSKQYKDRVVVLTDELIQLCKSYMRVREQFGFGGDYLFSNNSGGAFSPRWLINKFKKCWKIAGVNELPNPKPRIYDFRHTYATNRLYEWMEQKEDINAFLPYLSAYMGHAKLSDTAYYIHLLPERLTSSKTINWKSFADLLPEVPL